MFLVATSSKRASHAFTASSSNISSSSNQCSWDIHRIDLIRDSVIRASVMSDALMMVNLGYSHSRFCIVLSKRVSAAEVRHFRSTSHESSRKEGIDSVPL
jgi:hypothetical protein